MAVDPEVVRLTLETLDHLERFTVLLETSPGEGVKYGSGVCIQIGDRFFVATCAHVIAALPSPEKVDVITDLAEDSLAPQIVGGNWRGGHGDTIDVGWLELLGTHAVQTGREFLPLSRFSLHAVPDGKPLEVCGFPGEMNYPTWVEQTRGRRARPMWHSDLSAWDDAPEVNADRRGDVFMRYRPNVDGELPEGWRRDVPAAGGLSGCGIWRPFRRSEGWTPAEAKLVGIQRQWSAERQMIRATRVEHWLRMVREDLNELSPHIDPILEAGA